MPLCFLCWSNKYIIPTPINLYPYVILYPIIFTMVSASTIKVLPPANGKKLWRVRKSTPNTHQRSNSLPGNKSSTTLPILLKSSNRSCSTSSIASTTTTTTTNNNNNNSSPMQNSSIECLNNSLKIVAAASKFTIKRPPLRRPKNKPGKPKDFVFVDLSPVQSDNSSESEPNGGITTTVSKSRRSSNSGNSATATATANKVAAINVPVLPTNVVAPATPMTTSNSMNSINDFNTYGKPPPVKDANTYIGATNMEPLLSSNDGFGLPSPVESLDDFLISEFDLWENEVNWQSMIPNTQQQQQQQQQSTSSVVSPIIRTENNQQQQQQQGQYEQYFDIVLIVQQQQEQIQKLQQQLQQITKSNNNNNNNGNGNTLPQIDMINSIINNNIANSIPIPTSSATTTTTNNGFMDFVF